jgi:hypothetical protein
MDDYMFRAHVRGCKNVIEHTTYLEILCYSVRERWDVARDLLVLMLTSVRMLPITRLRNILSLSMSLRTSSTAV